MGTADRRQSAAAPARQARASFAGARAGPQLVVKRKHSHGSVQVPA